MNDGPGIRTTVFMKGCPLDCRWCHNPESKSSKPQILYAEDRCMDCGRCVRECPQELHRMENGRHAFVRDRCVGCGDCARGCPSALSVVGRRMSVDEVLDVVLRDRPFYGKDGGLTVSGGEPFAQPEFLLGLLDAARGAGVGTCVETCGFVRPEDLQASLPKVDWFLYDCKETDPELHTRWTGVPNERILANLTALNEAGAKVVLRCPIVPGCNDREDHLRALGEMSKRYPCIRRIEIMPYHPLGIKKAKELGVEAFDGTVAFSDVSVSDGWVRTIATVATCVVSKG